jgi:hypothetical protein
MTGSFRLTIADLFEVMEVWDKHFQSHVFLAACGGTAITLYGHKESTRDVDFLVPDPRHYDAVIRAITRQGYKTATGHGYKHPDKPWIFDLFRGQTVFQTELLDPVQDPDRHWVVKQFSNLTIACLKPDDLIICKMFRGHQVDVDDSVVMIKSEQVDLQNLALRYVETAGYYFNPAVCKKNLRYLIADLKSEGVDVAPLKEVYEKWIP